MSGFNFGQIGPILNQYMDNDSMDIERTIQIIKPDGTTGESMPGVPLYRDVKCHISFDSADNPNPTTSDTMPIIMGITISCDPDTDLQNGDIITARKLDASGEVLETYRGTIGEPYVVQSRKRANMAVQTFTEAT